MLYKHAIVPYGAAMAGLPSQIAYGGWQKFRHGGVIAAILQHWSGDLVDVLNFNNTGLEI